MFFEYIFLGKYFAPNVICTTKTITSAIAVEKAAPFCEYIGIRNQFNVKLTNAAPKVLKITIFSFPLGYKISMQRSIVLLALYTGTTIEIKGLI